MKNKRALLLASLISLTTLASCGGSGSGEYDVWTTYSTAKVTQQASRNERFVNNGQKVKIQMMRDEYESSQLIITSDSKQYFDLVKSDLVDEETNNRIPADKIEIYVQKYMEILSNRYNPKSDHFYGGDMIPDFLLPLKYAKSHDENFVKANSNQGITIEVDSNGLKAGNYKGEFTLKIGSKEQQIPVEVTIWDFALEGKSEIQTCWLIYSMYMFTGEYDASEKMIDTYSDFLTRYKANPYVIQDSPMNSPEALMQDVERMWGMKNFNSIIIPYDFPLTYKAEGSQVETAASYIVKLAEKSTEENFYLDYAYFYPSTYDEADAITPKKLASPEFFKKGGSYDQTLEYAIKKLEQKGYFVGKSDEWNERVKKAIRNIPDVFTNVNYVEKWVEEWPATFCPKINVLDSVKNQEIYKDYANVFSEGDLWTYTCCDPDYPYPSHHLDDDCLSMRVLGWMEKSFNINGYLYYMTNMYKTENDSSEFDTPYTGADRNGAANGDGYIMYPGRPYGSNEPFPSMRLITYRDGLEDFEMLEIYEKLIKEACEKYGIIDLDPKEFVSDLYDSLFTNAIPTEDHHALYNAREELANRILNFEKDGNFFNRVTHQNGEINLHIYCQEPSLVLNSSDTLHGEHLGENNYHYVVALGEEAKDLVFEGNDNVTFKYHNPGYKNITNFSSDSDTDITLSDESVYTMENGKINVTIESVEKEEEYETIAFIPSINIDNIDLTNTKKIVFNYKNVSDKEKVAFDIELETARNSYLVGSHFAIAGNEKTVEIDLTKANIDLSKVISFRLVFDNYYNNEEGLGISTYETRKLVIEDLFAQY